MGASGSNCKCLHRWQDLACASLSLEYAIDGEVGGKKKLRSLFFSTLGDSTSMTKSLIIVHNKGVLGQFETSVDSWFFILETLNVVNS